MELFYLFWFGCAVLCWIVANSKARTAGIWFLFGVFLGPLALLAVWLMPSVARADDPTSRTSTSMSGWAVLAIIAGSIYMFGKIFGGADTAPPAPTVASQITATASPAVIIPELTAKQVFDKLPADAKREFFASMLLQSVDDANPHLNHMRKRIRKFGTGYEIMIVHDLFTKYTLAAGATDGVFQEWIRKNEDELKKVNVIRVGVWGTGEYASGAWFTLDK